MYSINFKAFCSRRNATRVFDFIFLAISFMRDILSEKSSISNRTRSSVSRFPPTKRSPWKVCMRMRWRTPCSASTCQLRNSCPINFQRGSSSSVSCALSENNTCQTSSRRHRRRDSKSAMMIQRSRASLSQKDGSRSWWSIPTTQVSIMIWYL